MIAEAVSAVLAERGKAVDVRVQVFVPKGEELAKNTLNARLGILGGISILGTTGVVRPMSHAAYIATIHSALSVAAAVGIREVVLTTGRRSERFGQRLFDGLPEEAFVQMGDFFEAALKAVSEKGLSTAILAVFFGKAVKMAQGVSHTHAANAAMTLKALARWTARLTGDDALARQVAQANTARHALEYIMPDHPAVVAETGRRMTAAARRFAGPELAVGGVIFGFDGEIIYREEPAREGA